MDNESIGACSFFSERDFFVSLVDSGHWTATHDNHPWDDNRQGDIDSLLPSGEKQALFFVRPRGEAIGSKTEQVTADLYVKDGGTLASKLFPFRVTHTTSSKGMEEPFKSGCSCQGQTRVTGYLDLDNPSGTKGKSPKSTSLPTVRGRSVNRFRRPRPGFLDEVNGKPKSPAFEIRVFPPRAFSAPLLMYWIAF